MNSELTKNSKKIIKKQLRILKKINLKNPLKTATMSFTNTFKKFRENQRIKEVNRIKFEEKEKNQNYQTKNTRGKKTKIRRRKTNQKKLFRKNKKRKTNNWRSKKTKIKNRKTTTTKWKTQN